MAEIRRVFQEAGGGNYDFFSQNMIFFQAYYEKKKSLVGKSDGHAWKKWATWQPGRRETGDISGKFEGKNEEGKGKEEGKEKGKEK